uniref:HECT and RLD domain containing E3 ubiquitin protein ligase 4 n=1 Tax=Astyanax mexicanus TaxID=7994 RepID=A0A8B9KWM2_ASTMX
MLCWGNASYGQLGLGGIDEEIVVEPRKCSFFNGKLVWDVGCGRRHTVFLLGDGTVYTCGCNDLGQLGHEKTRKKPEQVVALDAQNIVAVSCGESHTLALNDKGQVFAWGQASEGQLGLANMEDCVRVPRNIKSLSEVHIVQVTCGYRHSLALSRRGQIFSWGQNKYGQLGLGKEGPSVLTPQLVQSLLGIPFAQISAGGAHSFGLTLSGAVFGWGRNKFGQLGLNDNSDRCAPCLLKTLRSQRVVYICCGEDHTHTMAFIPSSGKIDSFGLGGNGQLGTRSTCNRKSPAPVKGQWRAYNDPIPMEEGQYTQHRIMGITDCQVSFSLSIEHLLDGSCSSNLIPNLSSSPPDIEALRLYLTLPQCPLFSNPNTYITLAIPFAKAVTSLKPAALKVLGNWWSRIEPAVFQGMVELYKDVVVYLLRMQKPIIRLDVQRGFTTAFLLQVNERSGQIIQYDKFYIHELEELVDIRQEYVSWLQQQFSPIDSQVSLCRYSFILDAQAKTTLLQIDAVFQMQLAVDQANRLSSMYLSGAAMESVNPCLILIVRRENVVGDTMEVLRKSKNVDYKKPLKVIFVGEEAVDAGGVRKEFFLLIMKELLDPKYGMFRYYEESRLIWFADKTFEEVDLFHLIGVICGLAIYNLTIVELNFPVALYKKLLKRTPTLDDLKELMPDVGRSLQQLLDYTEDDVEETFCLNFTITVENFGATEVLELVPNGMDINVNNHNRQDFVNAYVDYIFNTSVAQLFNAFHAGFHKVCGGNVLELFQPNELQAMVIGNTNYDWKELEQSAEYKGEYWAGHPTIKLFWEVFHELPLEKKKQFLLFLTGSDRIPILGMKSLALVIQPTGGGEHYLPVAHTCFNLLDLPKYNSRQILQEKLLKAIEHNQGFNLA